MSLKRGIRRKITGANWSNKNWDWRKCEQIKNW